MSDKPAEFTPTRILDMRPTGATPLGGAKVPDDFHQGGSGGRKGPPPDPSGNPTQIISAGNAPTEPLLPPTRPMPSMAGTEAAAQQGGGMTVFHQELNYQTVGWLAIVGGKGYGNVLPLGAKQNSIGRGPKQRVRFDFGDEEISREKHCFIIYESRSRSFTILRGVEAGISFVNNELLLEPRQLQSGDIIQMGKTFARFVPLCGPEFSWELPQMTEENAFPPESPNE